MRLSRSERQQSDTYWFAGPNRIADVLIGRSLMPAKARLDALHVALAAVGGVQFLLTQNCRHIANAHTLPGVYKTLDELGFPGLLIYTPAEFLGSFENES